MTYSYITNWLPKEDASAKIKALIADGTYKKSEIKLSSYRWADLKDHSKGYVARIHVVTGIQPDMELGLCGRKKKAVQKVEPEPVEEVESDMKTYTVKLFNAVDVNGDTIKETSFTADFSDEQVKFITESDDSHGQYQMILSYAEDHGFDEFDEFELVA